jgi:hypothetical protein
VGQSVGWGGTVRGDSGVEGTGTGALPQTPGFIALGPPAHSFFSERQATPVEVPPVPFGDGPVLGLRPRRALSPDPLETAYRLES